MTIDDKDMINSILESVSRIDYIKPEDIPNIDLYMDQVTTSQSDLHLRQWKNNTAIIGVNTVDKESALTAEEKIA